MTIEFISRAVRRTAVQRHVPAALGLVLIGLALFTQSGCLSAQRAAEFEAAAASRSPMTGHMAPDFTLPNQDNQVISLADQRGRWVVLYFYPEDGTPGCTCQAQEFTRSHQEFQKLAAKVFGVSPDTVRSPTTSVSPWISSPTPIARS